MRRLFLGLLLLVTLTQAALGQLPHAATQLSREASVSILTCAPGNELYSVFGHSAIRISDPAQRIDLAFNFGTFDFNTSFFYLKFGHGTLDYILSVSSFRQFMQEYFITGRSVWEQKLALTMEEKNTLFEALLDNALPQNRAYRYDFFHDNCATRVRDGLLNALNTPPITLASSDQKTISFRQAIHPFLEHQPWTRLGLDLILGTPADDPTDLWSLMFLPEHLMNGFATLRVNTLEGPVSLVEETTQLLEFNEPGPVPGPLSPLLVFWLLALVVVLLTLAQRYGAVRLPWLNPSLFLLVGATGLLIGYLSFVSRHVATGHNWNFLWANPFWFLIVTNVNGWWRRMIARALFVALLFLIFFFWTLPQQLPWELIPLWIILAFRLGIDLFRKKTF